MARLLALQAYLNGDKPEQPLPLAAGAADAGLAAQVCPVQLCDISVIRW